MSKKTDISTIASFCEELAPVIGPFLEKTAELLYAIANHNNTHITINASHDQIQQKRTDSL